MKILAIDNNAGARFYRLIPQLKWMAKQGHQVEMIAHNDERFDAKVAWADIVILEMLLSADTVRDIRAQGKPVIFECDDVLHTAPKSHYLYNDFKGWRKLRGLWRVWTTLRLCDGVISTNKVLNRAYGWMARRALIFPNYCDLEHWLKEYKANTDPDSIRLLWAGSTSHVGDLNWIKPVLKVLLEKYPKLKFIYIGMGGAPSTDLYTQFIYGEDFFQELPLARRESILPVDPNVWPYILASLQADLAIAPVEKSYFNSGKSQCKYLEYGINAIPAVYSRWHYTDVVEGQTGLLADSPAEWIEKLSLLIENVKLRKDIGQQARDDVIENFNSANYLQRWQVFVETIGDERAHAQEPGPAQIGS